MSRILRAAGVALACALFATGCGFFFTSDEDPLEAELSTVKNGTHAVPLRDLTDFTWDEVHLFNEYTQREFIEKTVGEPVISADRHMAGSLLVFEEQGTVVRKVEVTGDYMRAKGTTFGADVLAVPTGNGGLRLENPPS